MVAAPDFAAEPVSDDARLVARWIVRNADNLGLPFAIVDKRHTRLYVFAPNGRLSGASAVLVGLAPGDEAVADMAHRTVASLAPQERTTPAGRYGTEPGHNDKGEAIVWFDYDASLAIHRLRAGPSAERREERLASAEAASRRASYGCVVVPVAFYEAIVAPSLGQRRGIVYVLPEARPVALMFGAIEGDSTAP
ncbi:MAG: hypothetical protein ABI702_08940 [Burkholderiales bacterium]